MSETDPDKWKKVKAMELERMATANITNKTVKRKVSLVFECTISLVSSVVLPL